MPSRSSPGLLREPLLQFALLGGLLFLADSWWGSPEGRRIVVTPEIAEALERERAELLMRPITDEEREELIDRFIDDEVLLREAYAQGLDRADAAVRARLIDQMRFLLDEEPEEPAPGELEAWFESDPGRYQTPLAASFDHVYFAEGSEIRDAPEALLSLLRSGDDVRGLGDEFWLGKTLNRFSEGELTRLLGRAFTERVLASPPGEWTGPIESSRGIHFVRVTERHEPVTPPFEDVSWLVREDWQRLRREELQARKIAEIRERYRVEIQRREIAGPSAER